MNNFLSYTPGGGNLAAAVKSAIDGSVKAVIEATEGESAKDPIPVLFNPTEYSVPYTSEWEGENNTIPQYNGTKVNNFSVSLLFDTYEKRTDVREGKSGVYRLVNLTKPTIPAGARNRPPVCLFIWGNFKFNGVIETLVTKYTLFLSDGTPVRAKVDITMRSTPEVKDRLDLKGVKDSRKMRVVRPGDRLDRVAQEELGNPHLWHMIAELNSIENPLLFPSNNDIGKTLTIPHLKA